MTTIILFKKKLTNWRSAKVADRKKSTFFVKTLKIKKKINQFSSLLSQLSIFQLSCTPIKKKVVLKKAFYTFKILTN